MAGPTTAQRGARKTAPSRPPRRVPRLRLRLPGRRTVLLTLVTAVLLGGTGAWVLYGSAWLRAERVNVRGADVLTPDEVEKAAAVPMDSPLISVDTGAIERRVRARLPRIADVHASRSWPHTIRLEVVERKPEVALRTDGKFVEVDVDGVRFAAVEQAPKGVPLLEMDVAPSPSSRRFGTDRLRREGARVAAALPAPVHRDTRVIRVRSFDSITVELTGGRTVMWGSGERGGQKAAALTALLKAVPGAGHFDVSAPGAPAVSGQLT
ncbi:cell division protein FtsQ/DivIB [Streptomyces sp. XD-27]|uniref:cell division protein FtsQ/DivIB n=1 Tax=Streptomyces sp. XD-27 TaxID=3062779 RepID=UPI0026F452EE|nr:FtsQ-type POTRA domain-containing protein [Streptomyces sp. XD-27]WKX69829.1 FtsQ-type POTRA domain-containing protein [Streptomyces sp. XD-27]